MKQQLLKLQFLFFLILTTSPLLLLAQEEAPTSSTTTTSKTEISVTDSGSEWYTSPWVWIVGAAIFILLLVALLSNRGTDRDRVVVKKTVERD